MRVQSTTSNFITFRAISLNEREKAKSDKLISGLNTAGNKEKIKSDLFKVFDKHLQKEAAKKGKKLYYKEDVLQKMYLKFFETLENVKELTTESLIEILNSTKFDKNEIKEDYQFGRLSLNKKIYAKNTKSKDESKLTIKDRITYDNLQGYLNSASDEERKIYLKQIQELVDKAELTEREKNFLKERGSGKTFKQIAEEYDRSETFIQRIVHNAIAKIQYKSRVLPEMYNDFAEALISKYELNIPKDDIKKVLLNNTYILSYPQDKLFKNIDETSEILKINPKSYVKTVLRQPSLFSLKPETIAGRIKKASDLFEIEPKTYIQAALRKPSLFEQKPETLAENIKRTSNLLELDPKIYIKAALKQPALFGQKPETIAENIRRGSDLFKIDEKSYVKVALRQPTIFYLKPETMVENINGASSLLEIEPKVYLKTALRQPSLFGQKPETIAENVKNASRLLGIDLKKYISLALKQPILFVRNPETIVENIKKCLDLFKIDEKSYVKALLRQPSLFGQKPETLAENIKRTSNLLELDPKIYIKAALKQPALFAMKPETVAENVKNTSRLLKMEQKTFIETALIQPSFFYQKPESLAKKQKIIQYYRQIQNKDFNKIAFNTRTDSYFYELILNYLVKKADGLKAAISGNEFVNYLKESGKTYHFEIPDNELAKEFIRFAEEFAEKNFGKLIFHFKIKP